MSGSTSCCASIKGPFGFVQVLERDRVGLCSIGRCRCDRSRRHGARYRRCGARSRGADDAWPRRRSARPAARWQRADSDRYAGTHRVPGAGDYRSGSRDPASSNRPRGRRYPVRARPRPARTNYRRSCRRQTTIAIDTIITQEDERYRLRLRRGWPEELKRTPRRRCDPEKRSLGALHHRRLPDLQVLPACNGLHPLPDLRWQNISATAASMRWSWLTT